MVDIIEVVLLFTLLAFVSCENDILTKPPCVCRVTDCTNPQAEECCVSIHCAEECTREDWSNVLSQVRC